MPKPSDRKSGLAGLDPANQEKWVAGAAENQAAVPDKTKKARKRETNRVRLDVPAETKQYLAQEAERYGTSSSQLGAFLLTWMLARMVGDKTTLRPTLEDNITTSRGIKVQNDVDIPYDFIEALRTGMGLSSE